MTNFTKWEQAPLFDEWWHLMTSELSSAIYDRISISLYFGLPVVGFGETPEIKFDPMTLNQNTFANYRLIEEVLYRTCKFPTNNMGSYMGATDCRAHIQWSLMAMYNMGFEAALLSVKKKETRE